MLHVILVILKIIGIILAALLGILLTVILVVLFVPIGYDARIDNRNDILVKANGWWLFHALHVSFDMEGIPSEEKENSPVIKLRILGIPIIDTGKKKEEKAETAVEPETVPKEIQERIPEKTQEKPKETTVEKVETVEKEPQLTTQELPKKEVKKNDVTQSAKKKSVEKKAESKPRVSIIDKIRGFIDNIKKKLQNISDAKHKLQEKVNLLKVFIQNEENVNGIKKIFHTIKGIIKHILPNKIKGHVQFGLNDPCTTGQALGVLAIFYPYYGKSLTIEPDFTKQVLEGDVYLKGYIQIFTLCLIGIKLLIDANFRKLIKNFKNLKEEL